jgi:hypothetical protein
MPAIIESNNFIFLFIFHTLEQWSPNVFITHPYISKIIITHPYMSIYVIFISTTYIATMLIYVHYIGARLTWLISFPHPPWNITRTSRVCTPHF